MSKNGQTHLKILQQMLQDFWSVSDHFGPLCIKGLRKVITKRSPLDRSSRPVFCQKGVLRNFAKFTGKHLCQSLFFNKVAGLRPGTISKKRLWYRCFPANFAKFLRRTLLTEHLWWLLLLRGYWLIFERQRKQKEYCIRWYKRQSKINIW